MSSGSEGGGWEATDLRTGIATVFEQVKTQADLGVRALAAWAALLTVLALASGSGFLVATPAYWDVPAALIAILIASLAASRLIGGFNAAMAFALTDLAVVAFFVAGRFGKLGVFDIIFCLLRFGAAPFVLYMSMTGRAGTQAFLAFKSGFQRGDAPLSTINPAMMRLYVVGATGGALALGFAIWVGAIVVGFGEDAAAMKGDSLLLTMLMKMNVKRATPVPQSTESLPEMAAHGKDQAAAAALAGNRDNNSNAIPEAAKPIVSLDGFDDFARPEIVAAWKFGEQADDAACLNEALRRADRCRDDRCRYWARTFLRAALVKAHKTEHFCDGVPAPLSVVAGKMYAQPRCAGRPFDQCRDLFLAVQGHCNPSNEEMARQAAAAAASAAQPSAEPPDPSTPGAQPPPDAAPPAANPAPGSAPP